MHKNILRLNFVSRQTICHFISNNYFRNVTFAIFAFAEFELNGSLT